MIPPSRRYDKEGEKEVRGCGSIWIQIRAYTRLSRTVHLRRQLEYEYSTAPDTFQSSPGTGPLQVLALPAVLCSSNIEHFTHWAKPGTLAPSVSWLRYSPTVTAKVSAIIGREESFNMFKGIGTELNSLTPA
ncbi:hypothetical protein B9Z19DRAFT_1082100 [Tuber borchii]|uniref:Uncharacterized protein n=1 Tax=Tuber borchii TaxID=42251 RepID=A0A2T6ZUX7_TUBBO|nr:hypothetical protein B9Z19DRAFT_1082100 [Tuber borchii]